MTTSIRPATLSDIPALFTIRTCVTENALDLEQLAELGITPETIAEAINHSPCAWIAEVDGAPVGFSMVDGEDACVFAAFVLPGFEGRGIGRALMAQAEASLFADHAVIWLETAQASRASGFYRTLGWQVTQTLDDGDVRFEKKRAAER